MSNKTITITESLFDYWLTHSVKETEVMRELRTETQKLPTAMMQISPEQGQFMHFITKLLNVKNALEIGTFTGYSALAVASALPEDGKLIACDLHDEWSIIAHKYWRLAGVNHKIDLRLGRAILTLKELLKTHINYFDLIFIDADKVSYSDYYDSAIQLVRPGGLILIDNIFFGGAVADPENNLPAVRAIRALNDRLYQENNIDICILPLGDGITMIRKH